MCVSPIGTAAAFPHVHTGGGGGRKTFYAITMHYNYQRYSFI